jgi:hypothetical protein
MGARGPDVRAGGAFGAVGVCVDCIGSVYARRRFRRGCAHGCGFMEMARCRSGSDAMLGVNEGHRWEQMLRPLRRRVPAAR